MATILICLTAFLASILTFFSGFGLGTLLAPVLMFFFPVEVAIALTGIVHFFNNVFKLFLTGKHANKEVILRFGIPAVIAAFVGASLLLQFSDMSPLYQYNILEKNNDDTGKNFVLPVVASISLSTLNSLYQFIKSKAAFAN